MECNNFYLKRLDVVDSTNRYARDESATLFRESGGRPVAVTAVHQTAGRGQRGNVWSSEQGRNLLLSMLVRPGRVLAVANQFILSQAVALSLHNALLQYGIATKVKWPNDIYAGNRKLAGILVELDYSGPFVEQAIIGIGLNVNQTEFPVMDRIPVSMKMLLGNDVSVDDVLETVLHSFRHCYAGIEEGNVKSIESDYIKNLFGAGELCCFKDSNSTFNAVIESVDAQGYLALRLEDGNLCRYAFKEVEMIL